MLHILFEILTKGSSVVPGRVVVVEMIDVVVVVIVVVVVVALAALGVPPPPAVPEGGFSSSPSSEHAAPLRAPGSPSQTKGILVSISARPSTLPSWTSSVSVLPIRDPTDSWELSSRLELSRLEKSRVKLVVFYTVQAECYFYFNLTPQTTPGAPTRRS